jgi:uncharacterized membrane protein
MFLVRSKVKIITDERELSIQEKAARVTYAIFAPTLGLLSFLLLLLLEVVLASLPWRMVIY